MRRLGEIELRAPEARGIARFARHAVEPSVAIVGPAVVEAGVGPRVPMALAAHHRAAMAARIEEHAQLPGAVAAQDHRTAAKRASHEIAGRAHFALVAHVDPADIENRPHLALED